MSRKLVLASGSPRRRELLDVAGIDFDVRPAGIDEAFLPGELPDAYVARLAREKARAVHRHGETTLGADTTVVIDGESLGKPADAAEARAMLTRLQGRGHQVLTGWSLYDGRGGEDGVESTLVFFRPMIAPEIDQYVASGEPFDKAGGYGIQGLASKYVERIEGCYFNVVGLPVARVAEALARLADD